MSRLLTAIKTDIIVQYRTKLYAVGIVVALIVGVALSQLARPAHLPAAVPTLLLLVIGGSTLLYVAAMIVFERDEGTMQATIVSPLRVSEYLWSKIVSLTLLATVESAVIVGVAMGVMEISDTVPLPNLALLLTGAVSIGVMYTLVGIVLIVRYRSITDFLVPMTGVVILLQMPFIHFLGVVEHSLFLVAPTSAPTVLMQSAYRPLSGWEWAYAIGYTALWIGLLAVWADRAFRRHIVTQAG